MVHLLDTPAAGRYSVVYADPPWHFRTYGRARNAKGAEAHYATQALDTIGQLPVARVAADAAWLFMWSTAPHLEQAFELARRWSDPNNSWTFRTFGAWAKRPRGWRGDPARWQMGTGHIFRSAAEPLLVFGRGYPSWTGRGERNLWIAPIRAHSQKPDEVSDMIRRTTVGPRLEMFARAPCEGFDPWGFDAWDRQLIAKKER